MADETTEWVVVKHVRFPLVADEVLGRYPDEVTATHALNDLLRNRQWFTEYAVEQRVKGG